jgi:hypothetical protein
MERIVNNHAFELCSALLIMMNVLFMAVEMQYTGLEVGYQMGVANFDRPAKDMWPHAAACFFISGLVFNTGFVIELLLRVAAAGRAAIKNPWIWLDVVLVTFSVMEVAGAFGGFNPSVLRLLRFLRIFRMIRFMRNIGMLQSLFLLVKAIQESVGALVWTFLFLLMIQVAVGMVLHQLISIWIADPSNDIDARQRLFVYFGSFTRTMMTMFEITLANWVTTCRLLMTDVSEWFGLFYVLYRCMFCFGAIKVITAIFIAQTNRAMAKDDDLVMMAQENDRALFRSKLEEMFESLDTSRDGYLTWSEFSAIATSPTWRAWGTKLGMPMGDLGNLFEMLSCKDGFVSLHEFFNGIQRIKGPAKSLDMVWLLSEMNKLMKTKGYYSPTNSHTGGSPIIGRLADDDSEWSESLHAEDSHLDATASSRTPSRVEI